MTSDINDTISFGRYLKQLRVEKGLDLGDIATETRISMKVLRDIETENLDELPNQTVVKGFLRTYAEALGADRDMVVRNFMTVAKGEKMTPPGNFLSVEARKRSVALIVSVLVLCSIVLAFYLMNRKEVVQPKAAPRNAVVEATTEESGRELDPEPLNETEKQAPERQRLSITTVEETNMKIIIDAQPPKEYSLAPGDQLELEASTGFNILIDNAGGVKLKLNDKTVQVPGRSGQNVNILLP